MRVVVLLLLGFLVYISLCLTQKVEEPQIGERLEVPPEGYVETHVQDVLIELTGSVVFLHDTGSNQSLSLIVSRGQGENIYAALHNISFARPLTHDLMLDLMEKSGMRIKYVSIDRLEDGIYYATLVIKRRDGDLALDTRPSDGIVIALKVGAPIYVNKILLEVKARRDAEFPALEA